MRRAWAPLLAAGLALMGVAIGLVLTRQQPARGTAVPIVNVGTVPSSSTSPSVSMHVSDTGTPPPPGSHLVLDRLGVDAPIVHVVVHAGVMDVPLDPRTVGWWNAGAAPGSHRGTVVIVGHINYAGTPGALGVLPSSRPGDAVEIRAANHAWRYRIVAVHSYPKSSGLPASLFTGSGPAQLALITCGGPFDASTGNYEDNIVGYAVPA